jgi:hypothetical protein
MAAVRAPATLHRSIRSRRRSAAHPVESLEARRLLTTYYVSPTGSDTNPGTSMAQPWQTVAMVNATTFQPGDEILFQRGGTWRASLTASSDGAAGDPITYGAYGDATAAQPVLDGADVLDPTTFAVVTGNTYSVADATAVDWVFADGAFTHESTDALAQSGSTEYADPATNIAYVEANADTFYYDATTLYVNIGTALTGHTIEAATRQDAVYSDGHSHLVFADLTTTDTAADNGGYGFRLQGGSDLTVTDCEADNSGKHAFGVIDTTGFTGTGLTSTASAPDQGFGGASMIAFFVDAGQGLSAATASFTDCTYTDPGGAYPIAISHGSGTDPIASLALDDLVSLGGYGTGLSIQATDGAEAVTVHGGQYTGDVAVTTDDAVLDGLTVSGAYGDVDLTGTDDVVQNCLFAGISPDVYAGHRGGVIDEGTGTDIRFNTFDFTTTLGPAVYLANADSGSTLQGNIFACPLTIDVAYDGEPDITSDYNLFELGSVIGFGSTSPGLLALVEWQSAGFDVDSIAADPTFSDAAAGDYTLQSDSPAVDLVTVTPDASVVAETTDLDGNPRPYGNGYDAGAFELQVPKTAPLAEFSCSAATAPAVAAGTPTAATFTVTLSAAVATATTVAYATSNGTAMAGVNYTATSGTLTFAPGVTSRVVRVPVDPDGYDAGQTFNLNLSDAPDGFTIAQGTGTATLSAFPTLAYTVSRYAPLRLTDGSARTVRITVAGPGSVEVERSALGGDIVELIVLSTTAASTVTVAATGGHTPVGTILLNAPLGRLVAPTVDVSAGVRATASLGALTLGNMTGPSDVTLLGPAVRTSLTFGTVSDVSVASTGPLGTVSAASWAAPDYGTISAPSITALRVPGPFAANLSLTSTGLDLSTAALGNVTGGTWTLAGRAGRLAATSTAGGWSATVAGAVTSVATSGDLAGSLAAGSIASLAVGRDLSAATLTLTTAAGKGYDLTALRVAGTVSDSTVRSAGSVGAVVVGAVRDSTIFAGVAAGVTGLPTAASDLTAAVRLNVFTVTGVRGASADVAASDVAAGTVGQVRVTGVDTANGGTPFGFAATSLAAYNDVEPGKKAYVWTAREGAAALTTAGDYKVTIL